MHATTGGPSIPETVCNVLHVMSILAWIAVFDDNQAILNWWNAFPYNQLLFATNSCMHATTSAPSILETVYNFLHGKSILAWIAAFDHNHMAFISPSSCTPTSTDTYNIYSQSH